LIVRYPAARALGKGVGEAFAVSLVEGLGLAHEGVERVFRTKVRKVSQLLR